MVNPLSRVAMGNTVENKPLASKETYNQTGASNLGAQEEGWIRSLIKREKGVVESSGANKKISLEEAAKRIRNNY
ncbi:MAG: hypothetical protein WCZ27_02060 [Tissierellaceae bacterium]